MITPVVLDFDGSVLPLSPQEKRIPLSDWQESIRFGCSMRAFARLCERLNPLLPEFPGCVFTGSGDFHHVTLLLLRRLTLPPASLDIVVCDNHPDNMRYPFGVHCGSWVARACRLPMVRRVHVIGITSPDITLRHAWENVLQPFFQRKLVYWSIGPCADWLTLIRRGEGFRSFASASELVAALPAELQTAQRVYLSIDKDVLSPDVVHTNWDQGLFLFEHLQTVIQTCADRLLGVDVTGDVSHYVYGNFFKRFLSGLDGQAQLPPDRAALWQQQQHNINLRLLETLASAVEPSVFSHLYPRITP